MWIHSESSEFRSSLISIVLPSTLLSSLQIEKEPNMETPNLTLKVMYPNSSSFGNILLYLTRVSQSKVHVYSCLYIFCDDCTKNFTLQKLNETLVMNIQKVWIMLMARQVMFRQDHNTQWHHVVLPQNFLALDLMRWLNIAFLHTGCVMQWPNKSLAYQPK